MKKFIFILLLLPLLDYSQGLTIGGKTVVHNLAVRNIFTGENSGFKIIQNANRTVHDNAVFGYNSLRDGGGNYNTILGAQAASCLDSINYTVWIGYNAGNNSIFTHREGIGGIDISNTSCPLLFFDFLNDTVRVCGYLDVLGGSNVGGGDGLWHLEGSLIENNDQLGVRLYNGHDDPFDGTFYDLRLLTDSPPETSFNAISFEDNGDTTIAAIISHGSEGGSPDQSGNLSFYFRNNSGTQFNQKFIFGNELANDYSRFKIFDLYAEEASSANNTLVWNSSTGDVMPYPGLPISSDSLNNIKHHRLLELEHDDHPQYPLLAGRPNENLHIDSISALNNAANLIFWSVSEGEGAFSLVGNSINYPTPVTINGSASLGLSMDASALTINIHDDEHYPGTSSGMDFTPDGLIAVKGSQFFPTWVNASLGLSTSRWYDFYTKMITDNSTRVGIGNPSPLSYLHVGSVDSTLDRHGISLGDGSVKIFSPDSDTLRVSIDGTSCMTVSSENATLGWLAGGPRPMLHTTAVGDACGGENTGVMFVGYGPYAGAFNTGANFSGFGKTAGQDNTGDNFIGFGLAAGEDNTGDNTIHIGYESGYGNTGNEVISIGLNSAYNNTGNFITAIGSSVLADNEGKRIVAIGDSSLLHKRGGDRIVAMGNGTLKNMTSGNGVVAIGTDAAHDFNSGSNIIIIGDSVTTPSADISDYMNIGNIYAGNLNTNSKTAFIYGDVTFPDILTNESPTTVATFDEESSNLILRTSVEDLFNTGIPLPSPDINNDLYVDGTDLDILINSTDQTVLEKDSIREMDFNENGFLDYNDIAFVLACYGLDMTVQGDLDAVEERRSFLKSHLYSASLGDSIWVMQEQPFLGQITDPSIIGTRDLTGYFPVFDTTSIGVSIMGKGTFAYTGLGMKLVHYTDMNLGGSSDLSYDVDNHKVDITGGGTSATIATFSEADEDYGLVKGGNNLGQGYFLNATGEFSEPVGLVDAESLGRNDIYKGRVENTLQFYGIDEGDDIIDVALSGDTAYLIGVDLDALEDAVIDLIPDPPPQVFEENDTYNIEATNANRAIRLFTDDSLKFSAPASGDSTIAYADDDPGYNFNLVGTGNGILHFANEVVLKSDNSNIQVQGGLDVDDGGIASEGQLQTDANLLVETDGEIYGDLTVGRDAFKVDSKNHNLYVGQTSGSSTIDAYTESDKDLMTLTKVITTSPSTGAGCGINFNRARESTAAVQAGDVLGIIRAKGYNSSASYKAAVNLQMVAQSVSGANIGGQFIFRTAPSSSGTVTSRMWINETGTIGIGTSSPDKLVEINSSDGNNLRLTYNDADGSASNYADLTTSSSGDLTITPSGGDVIISGDINNNPKDITIDPANDRIVVYDNSTGKFGAVGMRSGGFSLGYALQLSSTTGTISPKDGQTFYFGDNVVATTDGDYEVIVPSSGTLKVVYIRLYATGTIGTNETITGYVRINATTDVSVGTVAVAARERVMSNTGLSTAVSAGDHIQIKIVSPTWETNPTLVYGTATLYIE